MFFIPTNVFGTILPHLHYYLFFLLSLGMCMWISISKGQLHSLKPFSTECLCISRQYSGYTVLTCKLNTDIILQFTIHTPILSVDSYNAPFPEQGELRGHVLHWAIVPNKVDFGKVFLSLKCQDWIDLEGLHF